MTWNEDAAETGRMTNPENVLKWRKVEVFHRLPNLQD